MLQEVTRQKLDTQPREYAENQGSVIEHSRLESYITAGAHVFDLCARGISAFG